MNSLNKDGLEAGIDPCPFHDRSHRGAPVASSWLMGRAEELGMKEDQYGHAVRCSCGASGPEASSRDAAVAAWNRRAASPVHEAGEVVARLRGLNPWQDMDWPEVCRDAASALEASQARIAEIADERDELLAWFDGLTPAEMHDAIKRDKARIAELEAALSEMRSSRVRDRIAAYVGCNADLLHDALDREVKALQHNGGKGE